MEKVNSNSGTTINGKIFRFRILYLVALVMCSLLLIPVIGWAKSPAAIKERGKSLFEQHCSVCHGDKGKGDGSGARFLFPKPRDFTLGVFKIRSTPTGDPPADNDILNTLKNGLPGSTMPSFIGLQKKDLNDLVSYVKKLGDVTEKPTRTIKPGTPPPVTKELIAKGNEVYKEVKCWECHGGEGKGDGPKANNLEDDSKQPAPPNAFVRGIYKGGGTPSDIYLRFTTGLSGSPMPSYEDSLTDEERWALTFYVKSLAGKKVARQLSHEKIVVKKVDKEIPLNPQDDIWKDIRAVEIPLMLLWQRQKAAEGISIKALRNDKNIAFLIEWEDSTVNSRVIKHEDFTDAVAVQFSLAGQPGHFSMGSKEKPVNTWQWRLDRQMDLEKFHDMEDVYPAMVQHDYQFEHPDYPIPTSPAQFYDKTYMTGWGAGNQFSSRTRLSAVEDLNAEGFSTLAIQEPDDQGVAGQGIWNNGKWQVVFIRSMKTASGKDVQFNKVGKQVSIAFAVWDGERRDRDGQKAVSYWQILEIEK